MWFKTNSLVTSFINVIQDKLTGDFLYQCDSRQTHWWFPLSIWFKTNSLVTSFINVIQDKLTGDFLYQFDSRQTHWWLPLSMWFKTNLLVTSLSIWFKTNSLVTSFINVIQDKLTGDLLINFIWMRTNWWRSFSHSLSLLYNGQALCVTLIYIYSIHLMEVIY